MTRLPDDHPVGPAEVTEFLAWYRGKVDRWPTYTGVEDHWLHTLWVLRMGELRRGAAAFVQRGDPRYVQPLEFWHLCKGTEPARDWRRFTSTYNRRRSC